MMVRGRGRRPALIAAGTVVILLVSGCAAAPIIGRILLEIGVQVAITEGSKYIGKLVNSDPPSVPIVTINYSGSGNNPTTVSYTVEHIKTISVSQLEGSVAITGSTCAWTITVAAGTTAKVEITGEEGDSIHCDGTPPSAPTPAPTVPPPGYDHLTTIVVPGNRQSGVQFQPARSGLYQFTYLDGAYSVYPVGQAPPGDHGYWLTAVFLFAGREPPFTGVALDKSQAILSIEDTRWSPTEAGAKSRAAEPPNSYTITLQGGQTYTLVGVDQLNAYFDNPGDVRLDVAVAR